MCVEMAYSIYLKEGAELLQSGGSREVRPGCPAYNGLATCTYTTLWLPNPILAQSVSQNLQGHCQVNPMVVIYPSVAYYGIAHRHLQLEPFSAYNLNLSAEWLSASLVVASICDFNSTLIFLDGGHLRGRYGEQSTSIMLSALVMLYLPAQNQAPKPTLQEVRYPYRFSSPTLCFQTLRV